jgi:hypothetical protein
VGRRMDFGTPGKGNDHPSSYSHMSDAATSRGNVAKNAHLMRSRLSK